MWRVEGYNGGFIKSKYIRNTCENITHCFIQIVYTGTICIKKEREVALISLLGGTHLGIHFSKCVELYTSITNKAILLYVNHIPIHLI